MTSSDGGTGHVESLVARACAEVGLSAAGARILHYYNNAVVQLPAENAVARVTTSRTALATARRAQATVRWLIEEHDFPATEPIAEAVAVGDTVAVGFWVYYPQPQDLRPADSGALAVLLRGLHQCAGPAQPLPAWEPLASLDATIRDPEASASLTDEERDWIKLRIGQVRDQLLVVDWPLGVGLIHGDAWVGNLLHDVYRGRIILGDWDRVSRGPREVDLIPTWHAATRYGRGPQWARTFAAIYGYDLSDWSGYPVLLAMRDLVQLTGPIRRAAAGPQYWQALRQRLDSLRVGDAATVWTAL